MRYLSPTRWTTVLPIAVILISGAGASCAEEGESTTGAAEVDRSADAQRAQLDTFQNQRSFPGRLGPLEPIYFIGGPKRPEVKFQLSLKYRLLNFGREQGPQAAHTLQFGYSQRSLWDVGGQSSPFYDTSYMPELFYQWQATTPTAPDPSAGGFAWLGLQSGFRHESNGQDGAQSRSWNVVYVQPVFTLGAPHSWHAILSPQVYFHVGDLGDNADLVRYRGYLQLRAILGRDTGPSLMVTVIPGEHFQHGSRQLDLTLPVRVSRMDFSTFLLLQYFDGYGESLRSYDQHTSQVRLGIELVR